ncbi:MAG: hypothetical protein PF636_04230 [Actinomycetota bacterium]|jgi:hypothetical protein|nr:hypothetical protein [Actinomycetota bacterium]
MSRVANVIGYIGLTLSTDALGAALLLFVGGSTLLDNAQAKPVGDRSN